MSAVASIDGRFQCEREKTKILYSTTVNEIRGSRTDKRFILLEFSHRHGDWAVVATTAAATTPASVRKISMR